jgi:hypothetical protein
MSTGTASGLKKMFQTALDELSTSDLDGLGNIRHGPKGEVYRYVKNIGSTDLVMDGCCLKRMRTTYADANAYVLDPDATATGPSTCMIHVPAGVPVTTIYKSGSATGDHGWIQVAGPAKVSIRQSATAVQQQAGCFAIATTICVTNSEWGKPVTSVIDSTAGGMHASRGVFLLEPLATTGVATVASAVVSVRCLD